MYTYPRPLHTGTFVRRYKRFLSDIIFEQETLPTVVHCANSGSMKSCILEGARAYTLDSLNPTRKLQHTLELIELEDGLCCLNTQRANDCAHAFLEAHRGGIFPDGKDSILKREAAFDAHTRFDFCLTSTNENNSAQKRCWVEVKSVSLKLDAQTLAFPDAVTVRGQKHLQELAHAKQNGDEAWLLFVIMRSTQMDVKTIVSHFRVAYEIDPDYATQYKLALSQNVRVGLLFPHITTTGFTFKHFEVLS